MKTPKSPYQEVTDAENEKILGTLTGKAWSKMSRALGRAKYYGSTIGGDILHDALQMSGSIGGKHRQSLVDAIQGAKAPSIPLLGMQPEPPKDNEKKRL